MNVDVRKKEDIVIVDFDGSLVVGVTDELVSRIVTELVAEEFRKILLNLSKVDYIDSSGLGDLVQSFKIAQRAGGAVKLLRPQERVRKTLHLSNLLPLFDVHEDEETALESFGAEARASS
ncbi:MAG TPA: STAS domain-containing protein [Thermoanaerobaculia bacterium]|nr:STAS domain-containing protein [Thermoanaerobaculia bacterium]